VLLALLAEGPMHPYRMQQLIKHRGKDRVANVAQPNSVYQTIDGLLRAGLVTVHATDRSRAGPAHRLCPHRKDGQPPRSTSG
jgi:DNA-binding PadR family transcriptional regulator